MVAEGDGIIAHGVVGGAQSVAVGQVRNGSALIDVAAVKQENGVVFGIGTCLVHGIGDVGHAVLERRLVAGGRVDKVAVHVGGLKDLDGLHGICFCVDGPFRFTARGDVLALGGIALVEAVGGSDDRIRDRHKVVVVSDLERDRLSRSGCADSQHERQREQERKTFLHFK